MKKMYENFKEIAEGFINGNNWTHRLSDHTSDQCAPWQHGITEFAEWLDTCGVKIIKNTKIYDKLWDDVRAHKPDKFSECARKDK